MGVTGWSGSNNLVRNAAVVTAYPFMISAWGYPTWTTAPPRNAASAWLSTNLNMRLCQLRVTNTTRNVQASVFDAVTFSQAQSSSGVTQNAWSHLSGAYVSTILREARHSGGNLGTNPTSVNPTAPNRFGIGHIANAEPWDATAGLAEVSVWNLTGFTQTNRSSLDAKLAAGESPLAINIEAAQPWTGMLVAYWRLLDTTDILDYTDNGHDLSLVGTLSNFASHPTVDDPPSLVEGTPVYEWQGSSHQPKQPYRVVAF